MTSSHFLTEKELENIANADFSEENSDNNESETSLSSDDDLVDNSSLSKVSSLDDDNPVSTSNSYLTTGDTLNGAVTAVIDINSLQSTSNNLISVVPVKPDKTDVFHNVTCDNDSSDDSTEKRKRLNNSPKYRNFITEPMGEKPVTEIAGIGPALGNRLRERGIDRANKVLGKYLKLGEEQERFEMWLRDNFRANRNQSSQCYRCLRDWCTEFL